MSALWAQTPQSTQVSKPVAGVAPRLLPANGSCSPCSLSQLGIISVVGRITEANIPVLRAAGHRNGHHPI